MGIYICRKVLKHFYKLDFCVGNVMILYILDYFLHDPIDFPL